MKRGYSIEQKRRLNIKTEFTTTKRNREREQNEAAKETEEYTGKEGGREIVKRRGRGRGIVVE